MDPGESGQSAHGSAAAALSPTMARGGRQPREATRYSKIRREIQRLPYPPAHPPPALPPPDIPHQDGAFRYNP